MLDCRKSEVSEIFSNFCNLNQNIIEIGSGKGINTFYLSEKCRKIYCFEPDEKMIDEFNKCAVEENRNIENITIKKYALSNKETTTKLLKLKKYDEPTIKKNLVTESDYDKNFEYVVNIKKLDKFEIRNVSVIIIDVDFGQSKEIIRGAVSTLLENFFPPIIWKKNSFNDDNQKDDETIRILEFIGYKIEQYEHFYVATDHKMWLDNQDTETNKPHEVEEHTINIKENLVLKYENSETEEFTCDDWHYLANHFRLKDNKQNEGYDCALKGLEKCKEIDRIAFYLELSILSYYVGLLDKGYEYCDKIILSKIANFNVKNNTMHNVRFYSNALPYEQKIKVNIDLKEPYINSSMSISKIQNGYKSIIRCVNYKLEKNGNYDILDSDGIVRTQNYILDMDDDFKIIKQTPLIEGNGCLKFKFPAKIKGLEDVRMFEYRGKSYFVCTNLESNVFRNPQICLGSYNDKGIVDNLIPLSYDKSSKCEKNWLPFVDNDKVYIIYTPGNLKLLELDIETGNLSLIKEKSHDIFDLGAFRGSSPPIPYQNGWLMITHEVFNAYPRIYYHRFVWYSSDFEQIKFTKLFYFESPSVEYNLGLCLNGDKLITTFSVLDNNTTILITPINLVNEMLDYSATLTP